MRSREEHEMEGRKCGMRKIGGIEERNLRRLYIRNMKPAGCYLRRNVRYKGLIKKSQRVTIWNRLACGRGYCPSLSSPFGRISTRSRHALHRPFSLRIKLGDKVAVSRWGSERGWGSQGQGRAKPRRKGGHEGGRKLRRTMAHVTAWMTEQLSGNILFYVADCIVYSCKSYKMFRALVTSL